MATTIAALSAVSAPAAFAGRVLSSESSHPRLASSFNGRQLALPGSAVEKATARRQAAAGPRAFLVGPCGPRGARYGGQGFYGRRGGFPCGPQGVVVVPVPGLGTWPDYSPPDPEQFEEYQKRQKEAYEQRRAAFEKRRAAMAEEAQKRRELREKQAEFFRKQQEELAAEREKWRNDYWNRGQTAQTQTTEEKTAETPKQEPAAETVKEEATPEKKEAEAPPKYPQSDTPVLHLRNEATGADLTIVGTAHSSEASVDAVRRTIREEQPGAVLVQLDRKRYNRLTAASPEQAFFEDMLRAFMGPVGGMVGAGFLGFYGMLAYRGMNVGREQKVAIQEARRAGAKIILGDRATDETMRRVEAAMSPAAIQNFFAQPFPREILDDVTREMGPGSWGAAWGVVAGGPVAMTWGDALRDRRVVRKLNAYMARAAPELYKVLVEERTAALVRALRHCEGKTVAVVDMSHLDGIEQAWQQLNETARNDRQAEVAAAESANAAAEAPKAEEKAEEKADVADVDVIDAVSSEEEAPSSNEEASSSKEETPLADLYSDVIDGVTGDEAESAEGSASTSDADVIDGVTDEEEQTNDSGPVASAEAAAPSASAEGVEKQSEGSADESSSDASAEERPDAGEKREPEGQQ